MEIKITGFFITISNSCSLLPAPCSLLPAPCSLFPVPCSLFPTSARSLISKLKTAAFFQNIVDDSHQLNNSRKLA
ncbi:hypothetical protein [Moorena producens]|uniref:hypothetical protein n=1 Tax=Moorena producens TaxID=1155739 RepID=UPI0011EA60B7|nr:hypothetical protein [Moorena producens]